MKPQNIARAETAGPSPKTVSNCKNWFCTCLLGIFEWRSFCDQRLSPICASNYNSNCCGSKWTTVFGLLQFYRRKFVCDLLFLNPPGAKIALGWNIANSVFQFFLMKFNISSISRRATLCSNSWCVRRFFAAEPKQDAETLPDEPASLPEGLGSSSSYWDAWTDFLTSTGYV